MAECITQSDCEYTVTGDLARVSYEIRFGARCLLPLQNLAVPHTL